ncbi:hypothetical protein BST81_19435 [Leptolyngbya sp. 'hensonii']|uniref:hypothetical protein n=1 Tax=Leptolyngbya sp. 'hensonii' TaxID=1922337 RepID=UPI000950078A|nr:hypothetical protein [Leptolyngbya sp. 'hensonii']OLP16867.1 hypothetical protein BST81_19435 [Leptolyngbya sp. 'hensonii']
MELGQEEKQRENQRKREQCLKSLISATQQLQASVNQDEIVKIADMIILAMTGQWRSFHTPEHIFEVGGSNGDAIEVLAALFHDLVYVQVDQGININLSYYLADFIKQISDEELTIRERKELPEDRIFDLVSDIFGFVPGQKLSSKDKPPIGQNEFLSAVIAAQCLKPFLTESQIAQIVICVEATIPFRSQLPSGLTAAEALYLRVQETNTRYQLGWTESDMMEYVRRAIRLANRDVENFAFEESDAFLGNTWNLIPETNHELLKINAYTVKGYRTSIQKMEGFMNFLKPELVFQQFRGEPSDEQYHDLIRKTGKNLDVAKLYLGSKLLSIAVLEALSLWIGDEIPLSIVMGELPADEQDFEGIEPEAGNSPKPVAQQLKSYLPLLDNSYLPEGAIEREVFMLLDKGRSQDSSYDTKKSPVATFIVKLIGFDQVKTLLPAAKEFFKQSKMAEDTQVKEKCSTESILTTKKRSAEEFLAKCDPIIIEAITDAMINLFESRQESLRQAKKEIRVSST